MKASQSLWLLSSTAGLGAVASSCNVPVPQSSSTQVEKVTVASEEIALAIEEADKYYQALFLDPALTAKGSFGVNRVIGSEMEGHNGSGTDPLYGRKDLGSMVFIYGNGGKRLNPATIRQRFFRSPNPALVWLSRSKTPHADENSYARIQSEVESAIKEAAKKSLTSDVKSFTRQSIGRTLEIRRVNLSKMECLPCHTGQKLGDPVALIAYFVRKGT